MLQTVSLNKPTALKNRLRQFLHSGVTRFVISDIDQTLFDSTKRFQYTSLPAEREALILEPDFEDVLKNTIYQELCSLQHDGAKLIFVSGRQRSLATKKQLSKLFDEYEFVRNSKLLNPTLSSCKLKVDILSTFLDEVLEQSAIYAQLFSDSKTFDLPDFRYGELQIFEDRADIIEQLCSVCIQRRWPFQLSCQDNVYILKLEY